MKTVVTIYYLRRYNKVCGNRHCDHEFKMGETVRIAKSTGIMYCIDCYYAEGDGKQAPYPRTQAYRVHLAMGYSGVIPSISVMGTTGNIPPVHVSWVRDNKRIVAKYTDIEIIREERLVNP